MEEATCILLTVLFISGFTNGYFRRDESKPVILSATVGSHLVMDCEVEFPQHYPIPYRVYWTKGDDLIYSRSNTREEVVKEFEGRFTPAQTAGEGMLGRASMNLTAVRSTDAGWYRCQAVFPHRIPPTRDNGTWFHVAVAGGNLLAIPPVNLTVREDDEATLLCKSKDPAMIRIRWLKDGVPLEEFIDLSRRIKRLPDEGLLIKPTSMGDIGWYTCEAFDREGGTQAAKAYLDIQYPAKVVYAPPEVRLPFKRSAVLDCHYSANPPLTTLRWEKDGFLFDPFNVPGVFYRRNGSLFIASVDDTHAGRYTCTPYNDLGTAGPSPSVHVLIEHPPRFLKAPLAAYAVRPGESADLPCEVQDGLGKSPHVSWEKKGDVLPAGRYQVLATGNLTINDIRVEDAGIYRCSASNGAAAISAETELVVAGAPSTAPHSVSAAPGATAARVAWKASPRLNAVFSVWLRRVGSNEWKAFEAGGASTSEATVTGLQPDTEYEMMVVCRDDSPQRFFSKSIRVRTLPYPDYDMSSGPIEYPRNISVVPEPDGSLLVTWMPPVGAPPGTRYVVRWTKAPEDVVFDEDYTLDTIYLIKDLVEGQEYDVQVIAVAPDGQQGVSAPVRTLHPGAKSIRASLAAGVGVAVAFLAAAAAALYCVRGKVARSHSNAHPLPTKH